MLIPSRWLEVYAKVFAFAVKVVGVLFCLIGLYGLLAGAIMFREQPWSLLMGVLGIGVGLALIFLLAPRVPALVKYQTESFGGSHVSELRSRKKR